MEMSPYDSRQGARITFPPARCERRPAAPAGSAPSEPPLSPLGGRAMKKPRPVDEVTEAPMVVAAGFADGIDDFLAYIELERGLSRNTAKSYESDLRQAAHTLKRLGASGWTESHAKASHRLAARPIRPKVQRIEPGAQTDRGPHAFSLPSCGSTAAPTIPRRCSAVRNFAANFRKTLTPAEMDSVARGPDWSRRLLDARSCDARAFYSSGLRISELCGLTLQQVDLENGFVRVFGKGSKERVIPLGEKAPAMPCRFT